MYSKDNLYLLFKLENNTQYALLANDVIKIILFEKPVSGVFSNKNVEGVIQIQGTSTPVININKLFFNESLEHQSYILVLNLYDKQYGLIVKEINGIEELDKTMTKKNYPYIKGFINQDNKIIQILNTEKIIQSTEL